MNHASRGRGIVRAHSITARPADSHLDNPVGQTNLIIYTPVYEAVNSPPPPPNLWISGAQEVLLEKILQYLFKIG